MLFRTVDVHWKKNGNVGWFPFSTGDGVASDIPLRVVPGLKRSSPDQVISVLVEPAAYLWWCLRPPTAALGLSEEIEEQERVMVKMALKKNGMKVT